MTKKLYLDDSFTFEFTAAVIATGEEKGAPFAVLAETHFYPEAGGQRADRGWLGDARVIDVQEVAGAVRHVLDRPCTAAPGDAVAGKVERAVREDHMQQHTGQHLLSAAFMEVIGVPTVSFHMGEDICTIDLEREDLTWDEVARVEDRVNQVIREDRPIAVLYPSDAERAALKLRKEPAVAESIRVIAVEGFDHSPCCGTHCARTGQVGAIHVRRWERVRKSARVHFLCGHRAIQDHRQRNRVVLALSTAFSARDDQLEARALDMQLRIKELSKEADALREQLWKHDAARMLSSAVSVGSVRYVSASVDSPAQGKALALALTEQPDVVAYLFTAAGDAALAAGTATGVNAGQVFKTLVSARGGKGGGQAGLAQGRLAPEVARELCEAVRAALPGA